MAGWSCGGQSDKWSGVVAQGVICMDPCLYLEEPGGGQSVARSVGRIHGLGWRPGELNVGISTFGGARGWPVGRAVGQSD